MKRTEAGYEFSTGFLKLLVFVFTIAGGVFSFGVSYSAARFELASKADAGQVTALGERFVMDSLDRSHRRTERDEQLVALNAHVSAVEVQLVALSSRITQLACYKNPNPACR